MTKTSVAWLVVTALLLVSCAGPAPAPSGGADGTSPPSEVPRPSATVSSNEACALVRDSDLAAVLGETPTAQPMSSGEFAVIAGAAYAECLWKAASGAQVIVRTVRGTVDGSLHAQIDSIWQAFSDYDPVAGVGDQARLHLEEDRAAHVVAVRGDDAVFANYQSVSNDAPAKRDAVIALVADTLASMAS